MQIFEVFFAIKYLKIIYLSGEISANLMVNLNQKNVSVHYYFEHFSSIRVISGLAPILIGYIA